MSSSHRVALPNSGAQNMKKALIPTVLVVGIVLFVTGLVVGTIYAFGNPANMWYRLARISVWTGLSLVGFAVAIAALRSVFWTRRS